MNQKHIFAYPRFLVFLNLFFAPKFFPLTYLPSPTYLPHLILRSLHHQSSRELEAKGQKREGGTRTQKRKGKIGSQEKMFETKGQKQKPKMRRQSKSLKVNSLPSLCFFCCFLVRFVFSMFEKKKTMTMHRRIFLWCCSKKGNDSLPSSFLWLGCNEEGDNNLLSSFFSLC
jgi:hypothetical protein